jgi:hypothetical protein
MESTMATVTKKARPALRVEECPWESGKLGRSEEHVAVADASIEAALDEAAGLQSISIRLQKSLIEDLKLIAKFHGLGYQPLMRDALNRFARYELRTIAEQLEKIEKARTHLSKKRA